MTQSGWLAPAAEAAAMAEDPFKWRPTGAKIIAGAGTEESPFLIGSIDETPTGVDCLDPGRPAGARGPTLVIVLKEIFLHT
jgi:hypothetical protein